MIFYEFSDGKISCVFGKTHFDFLKYKNSGEHLPILVINSFFSHLNEIFFGGVRNDPICQNFFGPQTSTRVGDTVS